MPGGRWVVAGLSYRGGVSRGVRVCVSVCVCAWAPGRMGLWGAPRSNHRRTLPAPPQPLRPRGVCPCPCPCPCPPTHSPPLARRQHTSSTGQLRRTLQGHSRTVQAVAIAPNGDYIVSGSWDKTVRIWDSASSMSAYTPACVRGLPGLGLGFEGVYVATRACAGPSCGMPHRRQAQARRLINITTPHGRARRAAAHCTRGSAPTPAAPVSCRRDEGR